MDSKQAKQIDSLYRNMKQLPLLAVLGIPIPLMMLFAFPLAIGYMYIRSQLLFALDTGQIRMDRSDLEPPASGELSTLGKIDYIRNEASRLWIPIAIGIAWILLIGISIWAAIS